MQITHTSAPEMNGQLCKFFLHNHLQTCKNLSAAEYSQTNKNTHMQSNMHNKLIYKANYKHIYNKHIFKDICV